MKILIEFLWGTEAAPVFSYGLAAGLKDNGHDVCCILLEETENRTQWVETFGEEHLFFVRTTPKRKDPLRSGVRFFSDCLKIRSKFRRICFDLTIRTFFNPYDQYILRFVRTNKNALICHDPVPHEGMDARAAKMNREALCRADDLIVLTKAFIPVAAEEYGKKPSQIHYMRHGLMTYPRNENGVEKADPAGSIRFLFFGRIAPYKGLPLLAAAYKNLSERFSNISLTIAGSGDFADAAEKFKDLPSLQIINRYIADDEVGSFFDTGNTVVVLPYTNASQSGVIPIAFAYGVPVISADTGGLVEQLFDGKYGVLFQSGDVRALTDAMAGFINAPEKYHREADKMREGRSLLSWRNVTAAMMDSWNQDDLLSE